MGAVRLRQSAICADGRGADTALTGGPDVDHNDSAQARRYRQAAPQLPAVLARSGRTSAFQVLPQQRRRPGVRHTAALDRDRLHRSAGDAPTTFGSLAARWLAVKAATKRESTVTFYESTLRNHVLPAFAHTPIAAITHADVQDLINTLSAKGLAPNTIRQIYRAVFKATIALALDDELIFRTPCRRDTRFAFGGHRSWERLPWHAAVVLDRIRCANDARAQPRTLVHRSQVPARRAKRQVRHHKPDCPRQDRCR